MAAQRRRAHPRYPKYAAIITMSVGILVLMAAAEVSTIQSITPGILRTLRIEINTAVAFVLIGLSLLLVEAKRGTWARIAGQSAGLMAAGMGALALVEYATGWDLSERLAIPAAFIFLMLGSACMHLYFNEPARVRRAQLLALGAMLIALFAIAGAFYGTVGRFTDVGVHTSLLIIIFGLGALYSRSHQGFMSTMTSPGVGGAVARRLLPAAVLFPFVLEFLRSKGEGLGLYSSELGLALSTVSTIVLLTAVVWINARLLNRGESAVFASMADGAISVDPDGHIVTVNRAMERLSGLPLVLARGRHYSEVYNFIDRNGVRVPPEEMVIRKAMEQREVLSGKGYGLALESVDGQRVPVGVSAAPILGVEDDLVGAVIVVRDVSYEEEVDQLKSQLISTVSHELRTPLTMIQGFSELLMARHLGDDDTREAVEQIHSSSERLGRLVNDLLSVARIESDTLALEFEMLDAAALVDQAVRSFGATGRMFLVDVDGDLPSVVADRDKVIQILTNLLSNAVKYSPGESPIAVRARSLGTHVVITVEDRGIGMSEGDLDRLFGKFFRSERTEVVDSPGTGLGLYIAKSLVEGQGGHMTVESTLNEGSSFSFTLAAASADPIESQGRSRDEKEAAHSR